MTLRLHSLTYLHTRTYIHTSRRLGNRERRVRRGFFFSSSFASAAFPSFPSLTQMMCARARRTQSASFNVHINSKVNLCFEGTDNDSGNFKLNMSHLRNKMSSHFVFENSIAFRCLQIQGGSLESIERLSLNLSTFFCTFSFVHQHTHSHSDYTNLGHLLSHSNDHCSSHQALLRYDFLTLRELELGQSRSLSCIVRPRQSPNSSDAALTRWKSSDCNSDCSVTPLTPSLSDSDPNLDMVDLASTCRSCGGVSVSAGDSSWSICFVRLGEACVLRCASTSYNNNSRRTAAVNTQNSTPLHREGTEIVYSPEARARSMELGAPSAAAPGPSASP